MGAGRRTTPLFDLVSKGGTTKPPEAVRASKPIMRVELKPREGPAPEPAPAVSTGALPPNALYLGLAAVLLVAILAWVGGVMFGRSQERDRVGDQLGPSFRDRPAVAEPHDPGLGALSGGNQGGGQPGAGVAPPPTPVQVPVSGGPVLTSRGMTAEPRERGLNYLNLASLPRPDAEAAIAFLAANGLDVAGIPVETPSWAGKNTGSVQWYALYVNQGLTREQLGLPAKTALEAQVLKLGQIWRTQHRGTSDFSRPAWIKFQ